MSKSTVCLPLEKNIVTPRPNWKRVECLICGEACYESDLARIAKEKGFAAMCTMCALTNRT